MLSTTCLLIAMPLPFADDNCHYDADLETNDYLSRLGPSHPPADCYAPTPRPPGGELGHKIRWLITDKYFIKLIVVIIYGDNSDVFAEASSTV